MEVGWLENGSVVERTKDRGEDILEGRVKILLYTSLRWITIWSRSRSLGLLAGIMGAWSWSTTFVYLVVAKMGKVAESVRPQYAPLGSFRAMRVNIL
jgi:hypothetical protein